MKSFFKKIALKTNKQFELIDITASVKQAVSDSGIKEGIALVFNPHTTAAVRLNHNEPLLLQDFMKLVYRLAPIDTSYSHDLFELRQNLDINERSNGHAHVKTFLFGSSETLIVQNGAPFLGEKQSVFFVEFDGGRKRDFYVQVIGE